VCSRAAGWSSSSASPGPRSPLPRARSSEWRVAPDGKVHARRRACRRATSAGRPTAHSAERHNRMKRARGPSLRHGTRACRSRLSLAALADLRGVQAPHEVRGSGARRDRLRRLRASATRAAIRHERRIGGPAPRRRRPADPRGARAALEHDEARARSRTSCGGARGAPTTAFCYARNSAGTRRRRSARLGYRGSVHGRPRRRWSRRSLRCAQRAASHVLVMSNGQLRRTCTPRSSAALAA